MSLRSHGARLAGALMLTLAFAATPSQAAAASQDLAAYADQLLAAAYPADGPGAAVLVMKDGQTVLRKGYGLADLELGVPVAPDMVFEIGSVTKQFTAAAILLLQEQGKLRVEDEITQHLPDYPTHGEKITIEHLLTHTSGIHSYTGLPEWRPRVREKMPLDTLIGLFKDKPLQFKPGAEWRYNNSGYILLGAILEKVSGKSYERFVEEEIFQKLGMKDSRYGHQEELVPRRASGYTRDANGWRNADYIDLTHPYAAGSLLSTVDDLAVWDRALSSEALLRKSSLDRMAAPFKLASGLSSQYGYGLGSFDLGGHLVIEHNGGIFGYISQVVRVPDQRLLVVILTNSDSPGEMGPNELALRIAAKAVGQPLEDRKAAAVDPKALDEYVGVYRFDAETTRAILRERGREGDKLFSQRSGGPKQELQAAGRDQFFFADGVDRLAFRRDSQGRITGVEHTPRSGPVRIGARTDEPLPQERQAIQLDPSVYDAYVGTYDLPGLELAILKEGGKLFASPAGQPKMEIHPESETRFFLKEMDIQIEFVRSADGKVTGLVLTQGGRKTEAKRK